LGDRKFGSILIIGKLVAGLQNGNTVDTEFIAQINLEGVTEGRPKGKLYKVWGVSWKNRLFNLLRSRLTHRRIAHRGPRQCSYDNKYGVESGGEKFLPTEKHMVQIFI
jgi:hypothetical protein